MQQVPRGDGERIWKVSNRSVALIPELYDEFSYSKPMETIRKWFPEGASFLGLETFKWFIIVVLMLVADLDRPQMKLFKMNQTLMTELQNRINQ
jgi:MscS family membrane protein